MFTFIIVKNYKKTTNSDLKKEKKSSRHECTKNDKNLIKFDKNLIKLILQAEVPVSAGELLIKEVPYAVLLLPEYHSTHCHQCCRKTVNPVPWVTVLVSALFTFQGMCWELLGKFGEIRGKCWEVWGKCLEVWESVWKFWESVGKFGKVFGSLGKSIDHFLEMVKKIAHLNPNIRWFQDKLVHVNMVQWETKRR